MIPRTLSEARKLIDELRSKLLSKPSAQEVQFLGMSLATAESVIERAKRNPSKKHSITPILDALSAAYEEECAAKEAPKASIVPTAATAAPSRPATTTRPTPARVQAPAPSRPAAARPAPAPAAPSPLSDFSNSKLGWLATHPSASTSDRVAAKTELARRGANLSPEGVVSQSYRRQPK